MEFFLDTADLAVIESLLPYGIVDGITTNPSLVAKHKNQSFSKIIKNLCNIFEGPISVEAPARDYEQMIEQGRRILDLAPNIVLKLPITWDGIRSCNYFAADGYKVNMTLCFSVNQALMAAKAGAYYVSPFIGRLDDIGYDGMSLLYDIRSVFDNYENIETKILGASIRNVYHVYEAAKMGVDVVTMPASVMKKLIDNPLTEAGLAQFENQWNNSGLKIDDK